MKENDQPDNNSKVTEDGAYDNYNSGNVEDGAEELHNNTTRPARKTLIEYQLLDGTKSQANVLWSQPKATSTYKNWLNVRTVGENKEMSIDWDDIVWWRAKEN